MNVFSTYTAYNIAYYGLSALPFEGDSSSVWLISLSTYCTMSASADRLWHLLQGKQYSRANLPL